MTSTIETTMTQGTPTRVNSSRVREFKGTGQGLSFKRFFTKDGVHPFDEVEWEQRTASITNERGETVFEQKDVEIPMAWSQMATNVVVSKYFRGKLGSDQRETSVKQLILRVVDTIADWGIKDSIFATPADGATFRAELAYLILHQKMAFNSPVWFNVGVEERPQASACFINSVEDRMESIMELAKTECMLFKWGSGAGSNLSTIRSSREFLSGGGTASGPVSFMRGYDAFAGVIKSGGKTRRAAKMVILDVDHPDIKEFVWSKASEEKKAWALIDAGYDGGFNVPGGAYDSIYFQNANHSVRVTDTFMQAVKDKTSFCTKGVANIDFTEEHDACALMQDISDAAWLCGDPGMQYDTTINDWHTCPNTEKIYASNPCSEYMFLNDTACNLASLNLMTYRNDDGEFDVESFVQAIALTITAQEIIVPNASYPTPGIGKNSHDFRPLGLGYTNLGALLMVRGLPYDSDEGRAYAGAITALMGGEAYAQSARVAKTTGPFPGYAVNERPMLRVIGKHRDAVEDISSSWSAMAKSPIYKAARQSWDDALTLGRDHGFRNAQVTVLAPTGTISFMMDCSTTGVEPDIALIKYKKLVGGGYFKIVNHAVPEALERLGYEPAAKKVIVDYLLDEGTIEGAPGFKLEHLAVFDCAFKAAKGSRTIAPMGHVRMMAAAQPFLSGAISKTVNMPANSTVEEISDVYMKAWELGVKAIAIYRDGCKRTQPLSTSLDSGNDDAQEAVTLEQAVAESATSAVMSAGRRRRLPAERPAITHKFSIAGHDGYITAGMYEDGQPGEIFIVMSKEGSTISGLMDSFATSISLCLQYGVPISVLVDKFSFTRFEPSGFTDNPRIRMAKSIPDYIFRWMADKFLSPDEKLRYFPEDVAHDTPAVSAAAQPMAEALAAIKGASAPKPSQFQKAQPGSVVYEAKNANVFTAQTDAPPCTVCGSMTLRSGACYLCQTCGATTGCG